MSMPVVPIPEDWDGESWKCWTVEWPDSPTWFSLLRGFITTPMRGRFWDGRTGSIIGAQVVGRLIDERNLNMEETLMSCNDEVLAVLTQLVNAVSALQGGGCCGGGSRGAGSTAVAPNPFDEGTADGAPPPGFSSTAAWKTSQCNMATQIANEIYADVSGFGGIWTALTNPPLTIVELMVGVLLTPIPFDDLIAIATYLISSAFSYSFLAEFGVVLNERKSEFICVLYQAGNVADARDDFLNFAHDAMIDHGMTETATGYVIGLLEHMLTSDSLNRLFEDVPASATGDCEDCTAGTCAIQLAPAFNVSACGAVVGGSLAGPSVTIRSVSVHWGNNPETPLHMISINTAGCCWRLVSVSQSSGSGQEHWASGNECGLAVTFTTAGLPATDECYFDMQFKRGSANTSFDITLEWAEC